MLAGGADPFYREILAKPHRHYVRIEVWSGLGVPLESLIPAQRGGEPEGGLCFYNGEVSASLNSRVTRSLQITVPADLYPVNTDDLLAPFGNEIRAFRGVMLADGSDKYTWPVFRGRIRDVSKSNRAGNVTVACADRASDVADNQFVNPQNSQTANTVYAEFVRLIRDGVPDAEFGVSDTFSVRVKPLTWELNRSAALDEMAVSSSAIWYALADGSFVLRRLPWTVAQDPVVTLSEGDGGVVTDWTCSRTRQSIYNVVTVSGERLNGDTPVFATQADTDPTSPTYWAGQFGVRSLLQRLQTPATQAGAQGAAATLLASSVAPVETWDLEMPADASLELGDALLLQLDGREVVQVISDMRVPLGLATPMVVSTRSLVLGKV
jgi:hypothetical protein